jgi:putative membrane protein
VRTRDHLANERTTLTWIRTGMILMGVGYTTDKLAVLDALYGVPSLVTRYGRPLGILAVAGGVVLGGAALPRFLWQRRRIESPSFVPGPWADVALLLALGLGGMVLLVVLAVSR